MYKLRHTLFIFFFSIVVIAQGQAYELFRQSIDGIVSNAIRSKSFPGCVIYAAKGDSIFFFKPYGYHTYDSIEQVTVDVIYDLASITKVVAGTLAMMKLYEDGYYKLDDPIGNYINRLGYKIGKMTFREVLTHQAGLYPWIPFYAKSRKKNGDYKKKTVSEMKNSGFGFALTDSLFLHKDFYQKIKKMIRKSEVSEDTSYKYSGLFFYLIPELVESLTDTSFHKYLDSHFYEPLGVKTLTFNPLRKFDKTRIAPTEIDTFFRMSSIHGTVHDEGAIMMKGISGNAGLFGNAEDLGKLFRMLLRDGKFHNTTILKASTIQLFTVAQYPGNKNRRGLGFDKPLLEYDAVKSSVAKSASFKSYGHTGYTGPIVWADPKSDFIFIFLTNRVYPSRNYRGLYDLNVRPTIHQIMYDYLDDMESSITNSN